jgi:hypothetical protein
VPGTLTIGEFSRVTHLSVKTLRHYHEVGLLEPVHVDPGTGYRRYAFAWCGGLLVVCYVAALRFFRTRRGPMIVRQ